MWKYQMFCLEKRPTVGPANIAAKAAMELGVFQDQSSKVLHAEFDLVRVKAMFCASVSFRIIFRVLVLSGSRPKFVSGSGSDLCSGCGWAWSGLVSYY